MKICRYENASGGPVRIGLVDSDTVRDVSAVTDVLPSVRWPIPAGDLFIAHLEQLRPRMLELARAATPVPIDSVRFKSPVANPGKFVCGAGNFTEVLAAGGHPRKLGLLFKMTSAAAGASDGVTLRWPERVTFHEMELAIVIGKQGTEIPASEALSYVAGYAIGLDMTMQGKEFPSFCKSFDTYGVIGPWMVTADEIPDPSTLSFDLKVNGESRQKDSLSRLVLSVAELIEHAASVMTLHPGDVIFSGTPPRSIGPVKPGDVMHAQMDRIGEMTVAVRGGPGRKPWDEPAHLQMRHQETR
jgi:2-keto-4-pentenoate hydratase/2-oxohepta-3-ene-1,7-dioic acid hydratase in catechol pathway